MNWQLWALSILVAAGAVQAKDRSYRQGNAVYYADDRWIIASTEEGIADARFVGDRVEFPDVRIVITGGITHIGRIAECNTNAQAIEMSGAAVSVRGRVIALRPRSRSVTSVMSGSAAGQSYTGRSRETHVADTLILANCFFGTAHHMPDAAR